MTPADRIRFHLINARAVGSADAAFVDLLSQAMLAERAATGACQRFRLTDRYGFTTEEIARHERAALDRATVHWLTYCDPEGTSLEAAA